MSWANTAKFAAPEFTPAGAGLSAPNLYKLGWLSDPETLTLVVPQLFPSGSITLRPVHGGPINGNPRMVRVIDRTQGWLYTAEFRAPQSWDQGIRPGQVVVHAMRTLYQAGEDGWRWCKSCEGLVRAAQTACPAGGVHDGSSSGDYWLALNSGPGQNNWRWCMNCGGLFYAGGASHGVCPAGGTHSVFESGDYSLLTRGTGQSNWKWCNKCQGLAFAGNSSPGVCPAGGLHDHSGSGNYVLPASSIAGHQNKWRWCNKCQGLYYAGFGKCTGGDVHLLTGDSYDYALWYGLENASGQPNWRWCSKCYGMTYYDGSRAPGVCAGGGTHNVSATGAYYVIHRDAEAEAGQRHWFVCQKCDALNYVDPSGNPGLCSAGGNHSSGWEYLIAHDTSAVPGATGFHWCRKCQVMVKGDNPPNCAGRGNHDTSGSGQYVVRTDLASLEGEQAFWRVCVNCSALFMLDGSGNEKPCPAGGPHSPTGEYFLTMITPDPFWRWCRKCELMAFWDGSRDPGPCPKGGRHDHSGSGAYRPPSFTSDAVQLVATLVAGGSWSDPTGRVGFQCTAVDASSATVQANIGCSIQRVFDGLLTNAHEIVGSAQRFPLLHAHAPNTESIRFRGRIGFRGVSRARVNLRE